MLVTRLLQELKKKEARFIIATLFITIAVAALSARFKLTWRSGFVLAFGVYGLLAWFAVAQKDTFLKRLLIFGITAGFTELLADCWLVKGTGTLVYTEGEPMIACSPLYMPFAWAVILVQIGYLGWLISNKEKMWIQILTSAIIGLAVIPLFEHWAKNAGWWYYRNCNMVGNTPWYIILGEGIICSILPVFFKRMNGKNYAFQLLPGFIEGVWIWLAYFVALAITG